MIEHKHATWGSVCMAGCRCCVVNCHKIRKRKEATAMPREQVMMSNSTSDQSRAVVLLSGGMDSCVCAALAAREHRAAAVHVSYGQRTEERERESFLAICQRMKI